MNLQTAVFIGRSGCGKGTQADLLRKYINEHDKENRLIFYIETGARFREFVEKDTFSSRIAKEIAKVGGRQPDFMAIWMWANILIQSLTENEHLIIDGAPRSLSETKALETAMKFYKRPKPTIVYLNVGRKWSVTHLGRRGRADDVDSAEMNNRLDWFEKDVMPAVEYLKTNPDYNFLDIKGEQTIEKVHYDIAEKIFGVKD